MLELIGINGGEFNSRNLSSCWSGLPEKIIIESKMDKKKNFFLVGDGLGLRCLSFAFSSLAGAFG